MKTHQRLIIIPLMILCFASGFLLLISWQTRAVDNLSGHPIYFENNELKLESNSLFLDDYLQDTKYLLTAPVFWDGKDWLKAGLILGVTTVLYNNDQAIQDFVQQNRNQTTDKTARVVKYFGEPTYTIPVLLLVNLYGNAHRDQQAVWVAELGCESLLLTGGLVYSLKFLGQRHRPYRGDGFNVWDGPGFDIDDSRLSFPSGHSAAAFALATVIADVYCEQKLIPPLAYGVAALTALSRVNDNEHWSSDVFFGSTLGYFVAKAVINRHLNQKTDYTITPVITNQSQGIMVTFRF